MRLAKRRHPFHHLAHVIVPDHIHWILRPAEGVSFSNVVATMKRDLTWHAKGRGVPTPLWQDRFYDHVIRDDDDLARHLDYIHYNPVKHGLAPSPAAYEYSSFAEWVKRGVYTELWGTREPDRIMGMELE
jgi:putative transposase